MERLLCPLPNCGGPLGAERLVRQGRSTVLRRRVCRRCGYEVVTKEFVVRREPGYRRVLAKLQAAMTDSVEF
jgi:hypothetical protein